MEVNKEVLQKYLNSIASFSRARLLDFAKLAGDGSGRTFYRLTIEGARLKSAILLVHPKTGGPALSGDTTVSQEASYVELARFFPPHGVPVPSLLHYEKARGFILMEDVGDSPLFLCLTGGNSKVLDAIQEALGNNWLDELFRRAITVVKTMQSIPPDEKCVAFRRFLAIENYRKEISEFTDFYAESKGLRPSGKQVLARMHDAICETIVSFPRKLSHFDFTPHNIFVDPQGGVRVIDFQDACLVSPARDIVSLINDRGMDDILGKSTHNRLLKLYMKEMRVGPEFPHQYDMTLLHWDFRVTGRFIKLCQNLGTDKYMAWVPGNLRRLGRTLVRSYKTLHGMEDVLQILCEISPEVKEGVEDPWPL